MSKGVEELESENQVLKAKLKEHEEKGLAIYGRKIEVLNQTVRVLEAKLEMCNEQRNGFIYGDGDYRYNAKVIIDEEDQELDSITAESIKGSK